MLITFKVYIFSNQIINYFINKYYYMVINYNFNNFKILKS